MMRFHFPRDLNISQSITTAGYKPIYLANYSLDGVFVCAGEYKFKSRQKIIGSNQRNKTIPLSNQK